MRLRSQNSVLVLTSIVFAVAVAVVYVVGFGMVSKADQQRYGVFFDSLEQRDSVVSKWSEIERDAEHAGVGKSVSMRQWRSLLAISLSKGMKSRVALLRHPCMHNEDYCRQAIAYFGPTVDAFTRMCLFEVMREQFPSDPKTPEFGLRLLIDLWNASWPPGIDLKGYSPGETIALSLESEWDINGVFHFAPDKCKELLDSRRAWKYDTSLKQWTVSGDALSRD